MSLATMTTWRSTPACTASSTDAERDPFALPAIDATALFRQVDAIMERSWSAPAVAGETEAETADGGAWVEPAIEDMDAFIAAHPECRISAERHEALRPHVEWRARQLDRTATREEREELIAEIWKRVYEAATATRRTDPVTGEPVFDYLEQANKYVVHHAAGRVWSGIRRSRREEKLAVALGRVAEGHPETDATRVVMTDSRLVDAADPGERLEFAELYDAIIDRLPSPEHRTIVELLADGRSTREVEHLLGLDRRRLFEKMQVIRRATREAQEGAPVVRRRTCRRPVLKAA